MKASLVKLMEAGLKNSPGHACRADAGAELRGPLCSVRGLSTACGKAAGTFRQLHPAGLLCTADWNATKRYLGVLV